MPAAMEKALKAEARKKFGSTTSEHARRYIYGTMRKTGWTPSTQKKHSVHVPGGSMHEVVMQADESEEYSMDTSQYGADFE